MLKGNSSIYEVLGKLCVACLLACSAFILVKTFLCNKKSDDYQERLRKAYEGLSPEEY